MKFAFAGLFLAALFAAVPFVRGAEQTEAAAESAARAWLAFVDNGKYLESWSLASSFFRKSIAQSQWQAAAASARGPLGTLTSRRLKSVTFTRSVPGAPDGEYAIVIFTSSFEKKPIAIETVTPMVDADGTWRVSGYYIR